MKIRKKIGDLGKDQVRQIVQDFLDDLDEGAVALLEYFEEIENPEFETLELDNDNKILAFVAKDGSHYFYNVKSESIDALEARIKTIEDGASVGSFENIEDIENRLEIGKDAENNIYNYRKPDGTLVEEAGIETSKLTLTRGGMNDFKEALKNSGFSGDRHDYSDYISKKGKEPLHLPIPRIGYVNITNVTNDAEWVTSKSNDYEYIVEYSDDCGNYFKKNAIGNAQGRSSLGHPKKNISLKFFDDSVYNAAGKKGKGNKLAIKYGSWVPQSTFHLKSYYTDFFKGINVIAYSLADMIWKSRGVREDRPWKKALIDFNSIGRDYRDTWNEDNMSLQMNNPARCIPDGFPVIAFLNGEFYGIYAWQLKKDADNFVMKTSNKNHIHLDGCVSWTVLFGANGNPALINWNPAEYQGFEIRNPEDLTIMNGDEYDGDASTSQEPIDEDSVYQEGFTLNEVPQGFAGCNVVISIGSSTYTIAVTPSMSVSDIIDAIVAGSYSSDGYTCYKSGNTAIFKDILNRITPPDVTLETVGSEEHPIIFVNKVISIKYNSSNESHVLSNSVKKRIVNLSKVIPSLLNTAQIERPSDSEVINFGRYAGVYDASKNYPKGEWVSDGVSSFYISLHGTNTGNALSDTGFWYNITSKVATIKSTLSTALDIESVIDYILFSAILYNYDGFNGNWQWVTWDGVKWFICPYDCDGILGQQEAGNYIMNVNATIFKNGNATQGAPNEGFNYPIKWVVNYYRDELISRWNQIKQLGCVDFFMNGLMDWMDRIGQDNYEREWKKWPDSPSNRDSNVNTDYWEFVGERSNNDSWVVATGKVYDPTTSYVPYADTETATNTCWFKQGYWYKFRCVHSCTGVEPLDTTKSPIGFHDSIWRAQNMIEHLYNGIDDVISNL